MRFLVDAQLPPALPQWLVQAGHSAEHVQSFGLERADDTVVWAHAVKSHSILITKDEDFLSIRLQSSDGPAVVWLRIGNATNRNLISWIETRFELVVAALQAGEKIIEVR